MNVIYYKILADLWGNKTRTLQVVLIIVLGAFGAGLVIGGRNLTLAALNKDWALSAAPSMKISVNPAMSADQLLSLENIDGLIAVEGFQAEKIEWRRQAGAAWQVANLNTREEYQNQTIARWELIEGSWPSGDAVVMERGYGERYNLVIGDTIETRINERVRKVKIIGILNSREVNPTFFPDLTLYMDQRRFGEITDNPNYATISGHVDAFTADRAFDQERADAIDTKVQDRLNKLGIDSQGLMPVIPVIKRTAPSTSHFAQGILDSVFLILGIIGVMRAIGASSARISWLFIGEGLIQGLLSWLIAGLLGIPAAYYMTTVVLSQLFGDTLLYQFTLTGILSWLAITVVLGIVASWLPARNATRVSVRESLAYQ